MEQVQTIAQPVLDKITSTVGPVVGPAYDTAAAKVVDAYAALPDKVTDPLESGYGFLIPILSNLERDEAVLVGCTVLPALCAVFAILYKIICCGGGKRRAPVKIEPAQQPQKGGKSPANGKSPGGKSPAKGAATPPGKKGKPSAAAPAASPPELVTRNSVLIRNKKDAPPSSIGHPTRAQNVKNPKSGGKKPPGSGAYMA